MNAAEASQLFSSLPLTSCAALGTSFNADEKSIDVLLHALTCNPALERALLFSVPGPQPFQFVEQMKARSEQLRSLTALRIEIDESGVTGFGSLAKQLTSLRRLEILVRHHTVCLLFFFFFLACFEPSSVM